MLIELRCNVMVKDFLKYATGKRGAAYMNEKMLHAFINQWRVYYKWGEDALTTKQCVEDIKAGLAFCPNMRIYYSADVPDGYMRVEHD